MANKIELILRAIDQSGPGFKAAEGHINSLKNAGAGLMSVFTSLRTIIVGFVAGVSIKKVIDEAMDYNKILETSKLGIGAIITSMAEVTNSQGQVLSGQEKFNASQQIAMEAQKELRREGMLTVATYTELVEVYQGILAPALSAKMTFKETLDIASLLTNAVKSIGLPMNQIKQEARDLIQGGIQPASSSLAVALGITDAMVKKWREQGTVYKELKSRLEGFVYASREFENTWEGIWSNFQDMAQMGLGQGLRSFFNGIKREVKALYESLVTITRDASGKIVDIQVKPEVMYNLNKVSSILLAIIDSLKIIAKLGAQAFDKIPFLGSMAENIHLLYAGKEIQRNVEGVQIPTIRAEDLKRLLKTGMSPEEIGKAISAGVVTVSPEITKKGPWGTTETTAMATWDEQALAEFRKSLAETEQFNMSTKQGKLSEDVIKRTEKLQELINKLKYSERELVEIEAEKLVQKEKLSPKLVEEWKTLQLQKIEMEEQEKLGKARTEAYEAGHKAESEAAQARLEFQKQVLTIDDELAKRREALAVEKGELTPTQAAEMELDRKRAILEVEKQILQVKMQYTGELDPKAAQLAYETLAIQEKINRLPEEGKITTEEVTRTQQKKAFEIMKYFAADYHMFRQNQLDEMAAEMRAGGIEEADIQRWITDETRKNAIERYQFQLEYADNLADALKAKYNLMTLQAKNAAQLTAEAFAEAWGDIKSGLSDLLMDSQNGFKNWESIVTNTLNRVLKRFIDAQVEAMMGPTSGGGGLWSWISSLFGGGNSLSMASVAKIDWAVNYGPGFDNGGIMQGPGTFHVGPIREAAIPLDKGGAIPVKLLGDATPAVNIYVAPPEGTEMKAEETRRADGTVDLKLWFDETMSGLIGSGRGQTFSTLQRVFNLRPATKGR
jgi:hypothetical protein